MAHIIDALDQGRIDQVGGYPSAYVIENGKVYWATLDDRKEYNAPELIVQSVAEFIIEHEWALEGRTCEWCGRTLTDRQRRFCSKHCTYRAVRFPTSRPKNKPEPSA